MRRRHLVIGFTTCFFAAGIVPVGYVMAERPTPAPEQAAAAREQAAIAQENADRAALTAIIAEKQAGQKSPAARRAELARERADLEAREAARGLVLTLGDVLFTPDQSEPTTAAMRKLSPLVATLKDQPQRRIRIEGYTDTRGPESYNLDLSQRRAGAVRDFLIENGISPQRLTARGYGEAVQVASNTTRAGRQANRRVEMIVTR